MKRDDQNGNRILTRFVKQVDWNRGTRSWHCPKGEDRWPQRLPQKTSFETKPMLSLCNWYCNHALCCIWKVKTQKTVRLLWIRTSKHVVIGEGLWQPCRLQHLVYGVQVSEVNHSKPKSYEIPMKSSIRSIGVLESQSGGCTWRPLQSWWKANRTLQSLNSIVCAGESILCFALASANAACFTKLADKCWLHGIRMHPKGISNQIYSDHLIACQAGKAMGKHPLWSTPTQGRHRMNQMSLGSKHSKTLSCLWLLTRTEGPTTNSHPNVAGLIKAMPAMPAMLNL